jgi:hypothetical protein
MGREHVSHPVEVPLGVADGSASGTAHLRAVPSTDAPVVAANRWASEERTGLRTGCLQMPYFIDFANSTLSDNLTFLGVLPTYRIPADERGQIRMVTELSLADPPISDSRRSAD